MATRVMTQILSAVVVLVVVIYHALRLMASGCSGGGCDWYIPFSLFLPIIAILLAALTAAFAAYEARAQRGWSVLLGVCGVLASIGSILAALALSDNDAKVWVSTLLVLTVPVAVAVRAAVIRSPT